MLEETKHKVLKEFQQEGVWPPKRIGLSKSSKVNNRQTRKPRGIRLVILEVGPNDYRLSDKKLDISI